MNKKFEITIEEKHLNQLRKLFNVDDCEIAETDNINVIKECFFAENSSGFIIDIREDIKIKEMKE